MISDQELLFLRELDILGGYASRSELGALTYDARNAAIRDGFATFEDGCWSLTNAGSEVLHDRQTEAVSLRRIADAMETISEFLNERRRFK